MEEKVCIINKKRRYNWSFDTRALVISVLCSLITVLFYHIGTGIYEFFSQEKNQCNQSYTIVANARPHRGITVKRVRSERRVEHGKRRNRMRRTALERRQRRFQSQLNLPEIECNL